MEIDSQTLATYISTSEKIALVDVRSAAEYEVGHIKGAVNFTVIRVRREPEAVASFLGEVIRTGVELVILYGTDSSVRAPIVGRNNSFYFVYLYTTNYLTIFADKW